MPFEINCVISDEERALLLALTHRVRVLSAPQIARTWCITRRLRKLEEHGLIISYVPVIHPELELLEPVAKWKVGEELPDFPKASHILRSRWTQPGLHTKCIIASRAAGRMFAGHGGRFPRESEETHDVHLAAVYLRFCLMDPALVASWVHEEEIKRDRKQRRGRIPDAMVGRKRAIEFGGAYKKEKLIAFHNFCAASGFEYEVW